MCAHFHLVEGLLDFTVLLCDELKTNICHLQKYVIYMVPILMGQKYAIDKVPTTTLQKYVSLVLIIT